MQSYFQGSQSIFISVLPSQGTPLISYFQSQVLQRLPFGNLENAAAGFESLFVGKSVLNSGADVSLTVFANRCSHNSISTV